MPYYWDIVRNATGDTVSSCSVYVYESGTTTLAEIYADDTYNLYADNPLSPDSNGTYSFFAAPGKYRIRAVGTSDDFVYMDDDPVVVGVYAGEFTDDDDSGGIAFSSGIKIFFYTANPDTVITAPPGSLCLVKNTDGYEVGSEPGEIYIKASGTGNENWSKKESG